MNDGILFVDRETPHVRSSGDLGANDGIIGLKVFQDSGLQRR